jgi:hypothetical protein
MIAKIATRVMREGRLPQAWKKAEVVLIPKGGGSYRPICLLGTLAKSFEAIIETRLRLHAERHGLLSPAQYGFRKNRSTTGAIQRIVGKAEAIHKTSIHTRKFCLAIMLDVKNAFNSLPWAQILKVLKEQKIPHYLYRIVSDYLKDRQITSEGVEQWMTAGVPQGSILGPLLWNLTYDEVLRLPDMPEEVETTAYADDLALTVTEKEEKDLEDTANCALALVSYWMKTKGLTLAPAKSEAIMLIGKKKTKGVDLALTATRLRLARRSGT